MQTSDSLATIRQAHEGMVPPLERLLTDALGREVEVTATEACRTTFGAYVESLGPSFWSYRFHVQPCDG